ncbi:MAG: DUF3007 family protein, partial [Cyanobacteria bacterium P01_F01_bin.33]
ALLGAGGGAYFVLQGVSLDGQSAGLLSGTLLVVVLVVWTATYFTRVMTGSMSYHEQAEIYKTKAFEKQLNEMSPEELAQFQAELEAED